MSPSPLFGDIGAVGVIDLMMQIPGQDNRAWYDFMQPLFLDEASRNYAKMPAEPT